VGRKPLSAAQSNSLPVFGQIKEADGFRQFLMRGFENVRAEWAMVCTAQPPQARHRLIPSAASAKAAALP
jgi:hypothetical protein